MITHDLKWLEEKFSEIEAMSQGARPLIMRNRESECQWPQDLDG